MPAEDPPAQRAKLLAELYARADGTVTDLVNVEEAGTTIGLTSAQMRAAIAYLAEEGLIRKDPAAAGYLLTSSGVNAVEQPSTVPHSSEINVGVLYNFGQFASRDVTGSSVSTTPGDTPRGLGGKLVIGVVGSLIAAAIVGIVTLIFRGENGGSAAGPGTSPPAPGTTASAQGLPLHVDNDFRLGAWTRTSPRDGRYYSEQPRPDNGSRWLPNGTIAHAICWVVGEPYEVTLFTSRQSWTHWARLDMGDYVQLSLFQETTSTQSEDVTGLGPCA